MAGQVTGTGTGDFNDINNIIKAAAGTTGITAAARHGDYGDINNIIKARHGDYININDLFLLSSVGRALGC